MLQESKNKQHRLIDCYLQNPPLGFVAQSLNISGFLAIFGSCAFDATGFPGKEAGIIIAEKAASTNSGKDNNVKADRHIQIAPNRAKLPGF